MRRRPAHGAGWFVGAAMALFLGVSPGTVWAQAQSPRVDETTVALLWLQGRFRAPVTCIRADGSRVELEEAIVVREGPQRSGMPTLRLTFFGIDLPGATKCFNLIEPVLPDRRGSLYVTYRSSNRTDVGLHDFQRAARTRTLRYRIVGGSLRIRPIDTPESEARVVRFDEDVLLLVSSVAPRSDGAKLLSEYSYGAGRSDPRRRLRFQIEGPDGFRFEGSFIEDERRWR